jgi:hypothetical protein
MRLCLSFVLIFCFATAAQGQIVVWDYDDIPVESGYIHFLSEPGYHSDDFVITGTHELDPALERIFGYLGTSSPAYNGPSLLTSTQYTLVVAKEDGAPFDLLSIDMRGGINSSVGYEDVNLIFTAEYADGSVSTTYATKNVSWTSLETFSSPTWENIVSLTIDDDNYYAGSTTMGLELHTFVFNTLLAGDYDGDGDVDGSDLTNHAAEAGYLDLSVFASNFGQTDYLL